MAIVLFWPCSFVVILAGIVANILRRSPERLTSLGSARWTEENDLTVAGMLQAESGMILGRTDPLPIGRALRNV